MPDNREKFRDSHELATPGRVLRSSDGPVDAEAMKRISEGDTLAFAKFYDRYSALLFSIATKVVGDDTGAEEVLQDSALLVWERAPVLRSNARKAVELGRSHYAQQGH